MKIYELIDQLKTVPEDAEVTGVTIKKIGDENLRDLEIYSKKGKTVFRIICGEFEQYIKPKREDPAAPLKQNPFQKFFSKGEE